MYIRKRGYPDPTSYPPIMYIPNYPRFLHALSIAPIIRSPFERKKKKKKDKEHTKVTIVVAAIVTIS